MPAESQTISMQFDADPRLAAAAGGAARYFADAAGLDNGTTSQFQSATITVCQQELEQIKEQAQRLEVKLIRSPDRIEVLVSRPGPPPSIKITKSAAALPGIDAVQHETKSDVAVTRLTKYLDPSASGQ